MRKLFDNGQDPHLSDPSTYPASAAAPSPAPVMRPLWLGWGIVVLGFGGLITWAATAPLDRGVPVSGVVMVSSNRQAVQHLTGGTVDRILVKEGEKVRAGQILVQMNAVQATSQAEMNRTQYVTTRATAARLTAERDGLKEIEFPADLLERQSDPRVASVLSLQRQLFSSRRAGLQSELAALRESIAGLDVQAKGLEESRDGKRQQLGFLKEQLAGMRDLAQEGYIPRTKLLDLERTYAQVAGAVSEDIGNIGRARRQIGELKLKMIQRQQEYQQEVRTQLAEAESEAETLASRLKALDFDLASTQVKSPADGVVVGMSVFTPGGVVSPGFRMMDVVPANDPLVVEAKVPVHLIDKVRPELPVDLMFTAFNQNTTPRVPATVTRVSADRMVEEKTGEPYYTMQAQLTPDGMEKVRPLDVRPGMPVELFVKTGERTMMNYLFKPLVDRAAAALSEE